MSALPSPSPRVSVIVPVFNLESYVDRCLESLSGQTLADIEILVVDDGSTDGSLARCREFAARDPRMQVFTKANEGQGVARNFALDRARGEYVSFVDGDDWLVPDALKRATQALDGSDADFLNFGLRFVTSAGGVKAEFGRYRQQELSGAALVKAALLDDQVFSSPCNKLYRRATLERARLRFPASRGCEDLYFSRVLALHSRSARFIDDTLYFALVRDGSTTRRMSPGLMEEARKVVAAERAHFEAHGGLPAWELQFRAHVVKLFGYLLVLAAFRVPDAGSFAACVDSATQAGFASFAAQPDVIAELRPRNRLLTALGRRPALLRRLAALAKRLGWTPY